jgi:hypothetical protein
MADNQHPQDRTPREQVKRSVSERGTPWKPASTLPVPEKSDGYEYRWLRKSFLGQEDPSNMSKKMREGWEPVDPKEHPELAMYTDPRQRNNQSSLMEVGGLILARLPKERAEARRKYYAEMTENQMRSVDQQLANEQTDSRMPIFNNRQTKVTNFGRGS